MKNSAKLVVFIALLISLSGCALLNDLATLNDDENVDRSSERVTIRGAQYEVIKIRHRRIDHANSRPGVTVYETESLTWEINDGFNNYLRCPTPDVEGCKRALDRGAGQAGQDDHS